MDRVSLDKLAGLEQEGIQCHVGGRLIQLSVATMTLEDETDRRTFGFPNHSSNAYSLRVGDVVDVTLSFSHKSWRVVEQQVLSPCQLQNDHLKRWMRRFLKQGDSKRKLLRLRHRTQTAIRGWFDRQGFLEVETPLLVPCGGMEPHLSLFQSDWEGPDGAWTQTFHLPTSPEFHLKKMLSLGYERIFEFARSFRNREYSHHHQPEFTMLEWYRAYEGYEKIMQDTESMVYEAAQTALGGGRIPFRGNWIELRPPWRRISVRDLFLETLKLDLNDTPPGDGADLARRANARGYTYVKPTEPFEDVFFKLFLTEIELKLGWERPVILFDYPIEMAALSRKKGGAPRYCERFEVYIGGVELANAFGELTQPNEQARRFAEFSELRRSERGHAHEPDGEFMDALRFGLPPSAGIALGFDRLLMLLANETSLDNVIAFPHVSPLEEGMDV